MYFKNKTKMSTKILSIGDPHFQPSNIPEVEMFIDRIEKLAVEKSPDCICILGDLLHTHERLHTIALNKAYDLVRRMKNIAPTYVLVGNHDMCNNQQFLTENHWMNGMKDWENVIVVDKVCEYSHNGNSFIFCPYVPPGRFVEALKTYKENFMTATCIFAHQEFFGCKMGAIVSVEGDRWDEEWPLVISGHIHSRQWIGKNVYYTGSAMQHAFGESTKNIISITIFGEEGYENEEVNLDLPRKRIVYMDVENLDEYEVPQTEDKIKVTVSGCYEEFKSIKKTKKYKQLISEGVKVVFKPKKRETEESKYADSGENDFVELLEKLVISEKNSELFNVYQTIFHNKISDEEVLFVSPSK